MDDRVEQVTNWFLTQGRTLSLAESCTGGLLSSQIAERAGVSAFFLGGVVSYSASAKEELLGVPKSALQAFGEVSEPVAKWMCRGVRKKLQSDWAVSVTGIAGPSGGSVEKPVGFVCFGVAGPGFECTTSVQFENRGRKFIQSESAGFALDFLWRKINE